MQHLASDAYLGPIAGTSVVPNTSMCVHRAFLRVADGTRIRAWVKAPQSAQSAASSREILNELIGHLVGHAWGLPVPARAGLLVLPRARCATLPLWRRYPASELHVAAWWSEHAGKPSVKARFDLDALLARGKLLSQALDAIRAELRAAPDVPRIVAFDTIIANIDRNVGNLLGQPGNAYTLIDHGQCLTGPGWAASDLDPASEVLNVLRDLVQWNTLPLRRRNEAVYLFDTIKPVLASSMNTVRAELTGMLLPAEIEAIIAFLAMRAARDTAANRMGLVA